MKNATALALFFILLLSISSCRKDACEGKVCLNGETCDDGNCVAIDSCLNVTCLNGGHCAGGLCVCPPGYTGADCSLRIFTTEDDKAFGLQMEAAIAANPLEFPLLPSSHAAYNYLEVMKQDILNASQVEDSGHLAWKIYIVVDDNTLNAFCTPGGYIYIYTGLLKYIESASTLAGVIAHEMAHADKRHVTIHLTMQYGLAPLVKVATGTATAGELSAIAGALPTLAYSRDLERDADEHSVKYLCPTKYHAEGSSFLFQKMENSGMGCNSLLQFFATHPCPDNRITNIQSDATNQNCAANNNISNSEEIAAYNAFKASLP